MVTSWTEPVFAGAHRLNGNGELTEEAITNALLAAETMVGRDGVTAHAIDRGRLVEIMRAHGRLST